MNLLELRAVNPIKYSLALMAALFVDTEMASCCFTRGKKSTKPALPEKKAHLIQGMVYKRITLA